MLKQLKILVIIFSFNYVNSQQLIDKIIPEKAVENVNLLDRMKLQRTAKQISGIEQEFIEQSSGKAESSGGRTGRSIWSFVRNLFKGNEDSNDDPNDILPFGLGNKLLSSVNSMLGRVNTYIKISNIEVQPKSSAKDDNTIITVMDIPE